MTESMSADVSQNQEPIKELEKMIPQSEFNKRIAEVRDQAREHGKKLAMQEMQPNFQPNTQPTLPQGFGVGPQDLQKMVDQSTTQKLTELKQQIEEQQRLAQGQKIWNEFQTKVQAAKAKYPDFDEKVGPIMQDLEKNPNLVILANAAENTGDLMYELGDKPHKYSEVINMIDKSPNVAALTVHKIDQSIKQNLQAKNQPQARQPLSSVTPSVQGMGDGTTKKTTSDLRKDPRYRV